MSNKIFATLFAIAVIVAFVWHTNVVEAQIVTDGLVSYWTLDEADIDGDTVMDIWGENDGAISDNPQIVEGKINEGLEFDGAGFVNCGTDESLDLPEALTIELWMKPTTAGEGGPNAGPLCKAIAGGSWNWQLRYNAPGGFMGFQFNAGGSKWMSVQQELEPEEWYHITGTYDGSDAVCYLSGVETERMSMPAINSSPDPLLIAQDGWVNVFVGVVDEVRIYDRGLSENEVQHNFSSTSQLAVEPANKLATTWGEIRK